MTYSIHDLIIPWQDTAHGLLNATLGIFMTASHLGENDPISFNYIREGTTEDQLAAMEETLASQGMNDYTHTFKNLQGVSEFVIAELAALNPYIDDDDDDDDFDDDDLDD